MGDTSCGDCGIGEEDGCEGYLIARNAEDGFVEHAGEDRLTQGRQILSLLFQDHEEGNMNRKRAREEA